MLNRLTKRLRLRAAIALAVLYAVCAVMPSIALAFADSNVQLHCLTENGVHVSLQENMHVHGSDHGDVHVHGDALASDSDAIPVNDGPVNDGDGKLKHRTNTCCGIFCFAAVISDSAVMMGQPVHASDILWVFDINLDGHWPSRISRPPITFLSL
jgi:hypothetical protein